MTDRAWRSLRPVPVSVPMERSNEVNVASRRGFRALLARSWSLRGISDQHGKPRLLAM
jgi:hypothetical protein